MKLYELKKLEIKKTKDFKILLERFKNNNSMPLYQRREYNPKDILIELKKLKREILNIRFKIYKAELNIQEIIIEKELNNLIINTLENTPCENKINNFNIYNKKEIDNLLKEYEDLNYNNIEQIDYYGFITDIDY